MSRYVLVSIIGSGTTPDPFRVPLPTHAMVTPVVAGKVLVEVPDDDALDVKGHPLPALATQKLSAWLAAAALPAKVQTEILGVFGDVDVTTAMSPATLAAWKAALDKRYAEHAGLSTPLAIG